MHQILPDLVTSQLQAPSGREEENARLVGLIDRAKSGDVLAFEEIYKHTSRWLLSYLRRYIDGGEAEDVLAEVYLQAWRSLGTFDAGRASPKVWLAMMAKSRALDHLRTERRSSRTLDGLRHELHTRDAPSDGPEDLLTRQQHLVLLTRCLGCAPLTSDERTAIGLAYFRECSQQEIASLTGWPLGTVKTIIARAQDKLRTNFRRPPTAPSEGVYHSHP
jgi:RNA polymerase sigma-70 factor, ECF subfamily